MHDRRNITIKEFIGEGGSGRVYRARMTTEDGFSRDVAVKVLYQDNPDEDTLGRFRDEARILGLLRDRAIISADPPAKVGGRWAIVMEYADGRSVAELLRLGPIPPRVAVEVIQETARALDSVYNQEGPDGEPLRLLHRDIKPGNIQISRTGALRILDFGVARAEFDTRESKTVRGQLDGTMGYVAPERFNGEDGTPGDVFSLGMMLKTMLLSKRVGRKLTDKQQAIVDGDPDIAKVWAFATKMSNLTPEDRPSARDVEDQCAVLLRDLPNPTLRDWAETAVPNAPRRKLNDAFVGSVYTMTASRRFDGAMMTSPTTRNAVVVGTGMVGMTALLLLIAGLIGALIVVLVLYRPTDVNGMGGDGRSLPPAVIPSVSKGVVSVDDPMTATDDTDVVEPTAGPEMEPEPADDSVASDDQDDGPNGPDGVAVVEPPDPVEDVPPSQTDEVVPSGTQTGREDSPGDASPPAGTPEEPSDVDTPTPSDDVGPTDVEPEPAVGIEPEPEVVPEPAVVVPDPVPSEPVRFGLYGRPGTMISGGLLKRLVTGRAGELDGRRVTVVLPVGDAEAMGWLSRTSGVRINTMVNTLKEKAFRGEIGGFRKTSTVEEAARIIAGTPGAIGVTRSDLRGPLVLRSP